MNDPLLQNPIPSITILMSSNKANNAFFLGSGILHIGYGYHGNIDEYRIWNIARTEIEIQSIKHV